MKQTLGMREVTGNALEAGGDFLGHRNGLQRNTTQSSALESSSSGFSVESGLGRGEKTRGTKFSKGV